MINRFGVIRKQMNEKTINIILWLFTLSVFAFSCNNKGDLIEITDKCDFTQSLLSVCFYGTMEDEIDIRDSVSYRQFEDSIRIHHYNLNCDTARLPEIDFSKWMLIGKTTSGGGCSDEYKRKVYLDNENKKIIYDIRVRYRGLCKMLIMNYNFVLIPAQTSEYKVEYVVR